MSVSRNILAVGAYERDNFGDYLFYEILKKILPDDNIIPGSVIAGDMRSDYGFVTVPYDFVLKNYDVDVIWVVGGEVGGADVTSALNVSNGEILKKIPYSHNAIGKKIEKIFGATSKNHNAYIPNRALYVRNKNRPLIIQSVGLNNFAFSQPDDRKLLSESTRLVVRDSFSYTRTLDHDISSILSPDVVHSLARFYTPKKIENKSILLQINKNTLDKYSKKDIQKVLKETYEYLGSPITLFAAGTANGHDSLAAYESIINGLTGVDIKILDTRKPLDIVDSIASAKIVIGTSLHVRIVAATYNVPRISLENEKTSNYAKYWDATWPENVMLDKLPAVLRGLDLTLKIKKMDHLSDKAYDELLKSAAVLPKTSQAEELSKESLVLDWYNQQQEIAITEFITAQQQHDTDISKLSHTMQQELESMQQELESMQQELEVTEREVQSLLNSKSYKVGRKVTSPLRLTKKTINRINKTRSL